MKLGPSKSHISMKNIMEHRVLLWEAAHGSVIVAGYLILSLFFVHMHKEFRLFINIYLAHQQL